MTANVTVATLSGDGNTPLNGLGWPPFTSANVAVYFNAPKVLLVPYLNGNTPVLDGWGFNLSASSNASAYVFATQHQAFLGSMDIGQTFIFVALSPTIAPVAPRNTTFPFVQ